AHPRRRAERPRGHRLKVLLTGGTGMVGRNLLEAPGAGAHAISAPPRSELDLLDPGAVLSYIGRLRPDIIIHAAGTVGGIQANINAPSRFFLQNLALGVNVVTAA